MPKIKLSDIAELKSGLFARPDIAGEILYLQSVHFDDSGRLDSGIKPRIKPEQTTSNHLLHPGDVLFAAKGLNNHANVYKSDFGTAVASSSFIVLRIKREHSAVIDPEYLAWYLTNHPDVRLFHQQLGTTIPSISITKLKDLKIDIPPHEQQELIVHFQALRNREKDLVRSLEDLKDDLAKGILLNATKIPAHA